MATKTKNYMEDLKSKTVEELNSELVAAKKELFNLIGFNPARLGSNDSVLTVRDEITSEGLASHASTKLLTPFHSLRH